MGESKWKDQLLKTSLPLELQVAELLGEMEFWVGGEYSYLRHNQDGVESEFSVDVHVVRELKKDADYWGMWEVLIECKYSSPECQWVFLPFPQRADVIIGSIWVTEDLTTKRLRNKEPLLSIDRETDYCMKGVVLHASGVDGNSITRGQKQLNHAMAKLVADELSAQLSTWHDEELHIVLTTSILVTNAPLFVLNHDSSLDDFRNAKTLNDIASSVSELVVYQPFSPHMGGYTRRLLKESVNETKLIQRVENLSRFLEERGYERHQLPSRWHAGSSVTGASERVIVVTLDALPSLMTRLTSNIAEAGKSLDHFGLLNYDPATKQETITPNTSTKRRHK